MLEFIREVFEPRLRFVPLASHCAPHASTVLRTGTLPLYLEPVQVVTRRDSMFKSKLRRTLAKERRTTMDSRRLDRAATAQRQPDQPESEPKSDVPRFGERPSRH